MLVIRNAQIQQLIAATDGHLAELVEESVRKVDAVRVTGITKPRLRSMVEKCIAEAREAGVTEAENIAAFTALMFTISPWFHVQPTIAEVLADTRFSAGERLFQLFERVKDNDWAAAENLYDERYWFNEKNERPDIAAAPDPSGETAEKLIERILKQADIVDAAIEHAKATPGEGAAKQVEIEVEKLCFYQTAAKGSPGQRAVAAAETARSFVLGKAVTQRRPDA